MTNLFDEFIGEKLERIHYLPEGLGDYKTVTFSFAGGKCLTFDVELRHRKDVIYPAMRATTGKWEMISADKVVNMKEVLRETVDTMPMVNDASLDETDVCPISGETACLLCRVRDDCDREWEKQKLRKR